MDLCKQVVGPGLIQSLMNALAQNQHVKHFLLGNNIVGVSGSKAIAAFIRSRIQRIETWYLAGNCIDADGIGHLASAFVQDTCCKHLWLKRNPILPEGARHIAGILRHNRTIVVLDLDNCGLQDEGIELLFNGLSSNSDTLRHLYLDGNGITSRGCIAINDYFQSCTEQQHLGLESLFMSINRIGDAGAIVLSQSLTTNRHLKRLNLTSNGIQAKGMTALFTALTVHPAITSVEVGYASQSVDLGGAPNRGRDDCADSINAFVLGSRTLLHLSATHNNFTAYGLRSIMRSCLSCFSLLHVSLMEYGVAWPQELDRTLQDQLSRNIHRAYGSSVTRDDFKRNELWKVRNIEETVYIESLYRTRGFRDRASRRQMMKYWSEHDIVLLDSEEYGKTYQIVKEVSSTADKQLSTAYINK